MITRRTGGDSWIGEPGSAGSIVLSSTTFAFTMNSGWSAVGGIAAGAAQEQLSALDEYGTHIGLAFRVVDDILDVESSTELLGKQQGSDAANQKSTYTSILGLEQARREADKLYQTSMAALDLFAERADPLRAIADFIVKRNY